MMRQTGGFSSGATSTRSRPASRACCRASSVFDDAEQGSVLSDDADRRDADLLVDPLIFAVDGDGESPMGLANGPAR